MTKATFNFARVFYAEKSTIKGVGTKINNKLGCKSFCVAFYKLVDTLIYFSSTHFLFSSKTADSVKKSFFISANIYTGGGLYAAPSFNKTFITIMVQK